MSYEEIMIPRKTEDNLVNILEGLEHQLILVNGPNRIGKSSLLASVRATLQEERYNYKSGALACLKNPCAPKEKLEAAFARYVSEKCILDCRKKVLSEYRIHNGKEHTTLEALGKLDNISNKLVIYIDQAEGAIDEKNKNGEEVFNKGKFIDDINALLKHSNVKIVLFSRYSMEETFKEKIAHEKIACISLGGFDIDEKEQFFAELIKEDWYNSIEENERVEIRKKFNCYAGSHPQLLNAIRHELYNLPEDSRTAEALEQIIKTEIPKDSDSGIFRVYSRMDELLGLEEMVVNTETGKRLSYRDLYIRCFSADGRNTGFSGEELKRYKEELYSKGYALKNESGEYEAITPYMPVYLDKWRREALDELMECLDAVEDGLRSVISKKLLELMELETGGDKNKAWELAEEIVYSEGKPDENSYMNNRVEHRINGIDRSGERDSNIIFPLWVMSFEKYFTIMNKYWESPHFPKSGMTKGQYESLYAGFKTNKVEPILWRDEEKTDELNKLTVDVGTEAINSRECLDKLTTYLNNLRTTYNNWQNAIVEKEVLDKLQEAENATEKEKKQYLLNVVYDETQEKCVRDKIEALLKEIATLDNAAIDQKIELIIALEVNLYYKDSQGNDIFALNYGNRKDKFKFFRDGAYYICCDKNNSNSLAELIAKKDATRFTTEYGNLQNKIAGLISVMKEVSDYAMEKINRRRISFNRARNVAKHRNNLNILDVRRYTGLLSDCKSILAEIEKQTALPYYKISEYYSYFRVEQAVLDEARRNPSVTVCNVCGTFEATEKYESLPKIPGTLMLETSLLNCCQGDLIIPVEWLEHNWNGSNFDVSVSQSKRALLSSAAVHEWTFVCNEDLGTLKKGILIQGGLFESVKLFSNDNKICKGKLCLLDAVLSNGYAFRVNFKQEIQNMIFISNGTSENEGEKNLYKGTLKYHVGNTEISHNARCVSTENRNLRTDLIYPVNNEQISCTETGIFTLRSADLRDNLPQEEIDEIKNNREDMLFKGSSDGFQGIIQNRRKTGRKYTVIVHTPPQESNKYYKLSSVVWNADQKQFEVSLGDLVEEIKEGEIYQVQFSQFESKKKYNEGYFIVNGETARLSSENKMPQNKSIELEAEKWDEVNQCWWVKEIKSGPTEEEIAAKKKQEEEIKKLKEELQNAENAILKTAAEQFYILELDAKEKTKGTFSDDEGKVSAKVEVIVSDKKVNLNSANKKWVKVTNISAKGIHTIQKADELFGKFVSGVRSHAGENKNDVDNQLNDWLVSVKGKGRELLSGYTDTALSLDVLKQELPKLVQNALYQCFAVTEDEEDSKMKAFLDGLGEVEKEKLFGIKSKIVTEAGLKDLKTVFMAFEEHVDKQFDLLKWLYEILNEDQIKWLMECKLPDPSLKTLDAWAKWKVPEAELSLAKECKLKTVKSPKDLTEWLNWVKQLPEKDRNFVLTCESYGSLDDLKANLKAHHNS